VAFDLSTYLLLAAILMLAGFVQGAVGFAFGMISMGLSVFVVDARTASIMISPLAATNIILSLWSVRSSIHARNILPMIGGVVIGLPFGLMVLLGGSTTIIRLMISALLLYIGITRLIRRDRERAPLHPAWGFVAGIFGGFAGGAANISGPPLIAYSARQPWEPAVFKASLLACFVVTTLTKSAALIWYGTLSGPLLVGVVALIPMVMIGSRIGIAAYSRIDRELFSKAVSVLVIALGILLIF
jgi:uncharacterized protein